MLHEHPNLGHNVKIRDSQIGRYVEIRDDSVLEECTIGDYSYAAGSNQIYYADIGRFVSIASHVRINPGNHPTYDRIAQHHFTYRSALFGFGPDDNDFFDWRRHSKVTIGHDVWIGHAAIIMPGVNVGNGAVIGAGAVVTHDVAPYSVVAGVPAKLMKWRFSQDLIARIEQCRWWDWDHETLKARLPDFRHMDQFIEKYLS